MNELRGRLQTSLGELRSKIETEWDATPAAVLIPLYQEEGAWKLLFTRRTDSVDVHAGQISFPGGRIEASDGTATAAALREAEEEIGLDPSDVETLGQLNPLLTVTQFLVTPVVGIIPWPYSFALNSTEVARIFGVPIDWLADPRNLEVKERQPLIPGRNVLVYYFKEFDGETIWGVTARITVDFLQILDASGLRSAEDKPSA
ncbi:MAG: NUDIX hydrolase [Anaerolineales bacterium]